VPQSVSADRPLTLIDLTSLAKYCVDCFQLNSTRLDLSRVRTAISSNGERCFLFEKQQVSAVLRNEHVVIRAFFELVADVSCANS
jgi:hypothetical protein